MRVSAQKFNAGQDATSETRSRPVVEAPISAIEQLGLDGLFEFIGPSRRRRGRPGSASESMQPPVDGDTFPPMADLQGIGRSMAEELDTVVRRPPLPSPRERFIVLQRWEGTVSSHDQNHFTSVVRDLTDLSAPDEEVTLSFSEVADDDRPLACPGAVFYWAIGYKVKLAGSRERVSSLRFRRLPQFSLRDITRIRDEAARLKRLFG